MKKEKIEFEMSLEKTGNTLLERIDDKSQFNLGHEAWLEGGVIYVKTPHCVFTVNTTSREIHAQRPDRRDEVLEEIAALVGCVKRQAEVVSDARVRAYDAERDMKAAEDRARAVANQLGRHLQTIAEQGLELSALRARVLRADSLLERLICRLPFPFNAQAGRVRKLLWGEWPRK